MKCFKLCFLTLCSSIILLTVYSLPHEVSAAQWAKTYGIDGYDSGGRSILQTADSGYLVSGYTLGGTVNGYDCLILKLDNKGDIEWQTTHDGGIDSVESVQVTTDGGYIVAGWGFSSVYIGTDYWIEKLDYSGNIEWQKTYDSRQRNKTCAIQQTTDGGYIVAGLSESGLSNRRYWLLKLDSSGTIEWEKLFPYGAGTYIDIRQTTEGWYIVAGTTKFGSGAGGADIWVCKIDGSGNSVWQKTYGGEHADSSESIRQTSDGGYIVAGETSSFGLDSQDAWVLKLDGDGSINWQKTYGGNNSDRATAIRQTSDGGYIVAGETSSFGAGSLDFWVFKLDDHGNISWQKAYGGTELELVSCIQTTKDGDYIVTGTTYSFAIGQKNIMVLKIDSNGNIDGCDIAKTTNATASNTNVTGTISSLTADDTDGIVDDRNITPQKSTVESGVICEANPSTTSTTTSTEPTTSSSSPSTTTTSGSNTTTTADSTTTSSTTNGDCAPGCPDSWIGDDECDDECNVSECNYDNGDCWPCPLELIYGEYSEQTELLRHFRDNVLKQTPEGREIIRLYYQWSPVIVQAIEEDVAFKEEVREMVDGALTLIE